MSPVLQALNPWFDEYAVKPLSYVNPVAVSDAASAGEAVAVAPPAAAADFIQSSDGVVESGHENAGERRSEETVLGNRPAEPTIQFEGQHENGAQISSWDSDQPVRTDLGTARTDVLQTVGPTASGRAELTYAETIAQLEALLQGYRDFDDTGRDITDATLVYADPPPIYLRRARA